jgi:uncharacterized membrane protein YdbT with pleckstrin-like domain
VGYPEHLLTDDEVILRQFRPHWRVLIVPILLTILAIGALAVVWPVTDLGGSGALAATALIVLVWAMLAVPPVVRRLFTQYVLTTERIIVRSGIISRSGVEIPLENINNVLFSQSVIERALRYGDVLIESAGSQGQSVLADIPQPEDFQSEVYRAREERSLAMSGGRGGPRDPVAQIEALADLRDRGAITEAEFEAKKQRLLDQI